MGKGFVRFPVSTEKLYAVPYAYNHNTRDIRTQNHWGLLLRQFSQIGEFQVKWDCLKTYGGRHLTSPSSSLQMAMHTHEHIDVHACIRKLEEKLNVDNMKAEEGS